MADRIYTNDTAVIETELTDDETGQPLVISGVRYQFNDPNGIPLLVSTVPIPVFIGQLAMMTAPDGGFSTNDVIEWDGTQWNWLESAYPPTVDGDTAIFVFPATLTNQPGMYLGRAQLITPDGLIKSSRLGFEVVDPLEPPSTTVAGRIIDHAWLKLEDLFDSELGGPWLRDKTVKSFDKDKMANLLIDALYMINNEYQPTTTFDETNWPVEHIPLASQALLVESIYHLVRSYVEQPLPSGGEMSWMDRRDYFNRWQTVLTAEETKLMRLVDVFKMQYTGFGSTSILIGGYAAPITRLSKMWRTRYPRWVGPWGS